MSTLTLITIILKDIAMITIILKILRLLLQLLSPLQNDYYDIVKL